MKRLLPALLTVWLLLAATPLPAASTLESFTFATEAEEQHFKDLLAELRCLVCQNQSLADSDAELAHDLRAEVYAMVQQGQSDAQIIDFLVERYSDFVLYNPPVKPATWLIWFGPFVLLAIAALVLLRALRRQRQAPAAAISVAERARLDALLGKPDHGKQEKRHVTVFWWLAGIMLIVALLFVLPALLRSQRQPDTDLDAVNTAVVKAQLAELESDLDNGRLDEAQYLAACEDLERELLSDLSAASTEDGEARERSGRWAALLLVVLIPGLTIGLYHYIGTQQIIPLLANVGTPAPRQSTPPAAAAPSLEEMVQRLAERMQQEPDNAEGWVMLGRSYTSLQRYDDAAVAYARAHRLVGDNADLLADYADALVMANGRGFTDQAGALLMQALETDPDNIKALWLAGHWKNQQGDYAGAIRYWQRAAEQLPPDGEDAPVIAQQIRQARGHLAPGEVVEATQPTAAVKAVAAAGKAITVRITLDPQVAAAAAPEDTLFIFARAVSGPRMPLAIVRKQVSDLPLTVTLDDSTAMAPGMKLSNFDKVAVGARISKSGTAMPRSGDLQGLVTPVVPGAAQPIELNIDSRVP